MSLHSLRPAILADVQTNLERYILRILITGSRDWTDVRRIHFALEDFWVRANTPKGIILVSGACPTGADKIAEDYVGNRWGDLERHPADWTTHGKRAGFIRNSEMIKLGADICLAFIKNESKGATHTANLAEKAGILTVRYIEKEGGFYDLIDPRDEGRTWDDYDPRP
jgi:hypothetical protein